MKLSELRQYQLSTMHEVRLFMERGENVLGSRAKRVDFFDLAYS
jgi:hypothetical protein